MKISLPQHPPFRFVDDLVCREDKMATFVLRWNAQDLRSSFTQSPTLILVEALAQSAAAYFLTAEGRGGRGFLAQIDKVVLNVAPKSSEELHCQVSHERVFGAMHQFSGRCLSQGSRVLLSARFTVVEQEISS